MSNDPFSRLLDPLGRSRLAALGAVAALTAPAWALPPQIGGSTQRVSVDSAGAQADQASAHTVAITPDGRFVAFASSATNLVPNDNNFLSDIFVHDRASGVTERVSVDSSGNEANGECYWPSISADGRFVAFWSFASSLTPNDNNVIEDVFVHDRQAGVTTLVSSATTGFSGNGRSVEPVISADGRFVAFTSWATDLVPGDANGATDVFVRELAIGVTTLASVDSAGLQGLGNSGEPSISADGRFVAFGSWSPNLVPGDTNGKIDVFLHDRLGGGTRRVSVASSGVEADDHVQGPSLAPDGKHVAFHSFATNLVPGDTNGQRDVFVRDLANGTTVRASVSSSGAQGNHQSLHPSLSADGCSVAFVSRASNLVPAGLQAYNVYVHELASGATRRASESTSGQPADDTCGDPALSADGRFVAFQSLGTNLVPGDTNGAPDIFVRELPTPATVYCNAKTTSGGCLPGITAAGQPTPLGGFIVLVEQVEPNVPGLLLYSTAGAGAAPFQGGTLCLIPPLTRLSEHDSGGAAPCTGVLAQDFSAWLASGVDPALTSGQQVWLQGWFRDPAAASGTGLSDALTVIVCH